MKSNSIIREKKWRPFAKDLTIGQDILELVSSAMYTDPLSLFREYVQNSADAIDNARENRVLKKNDRGTVNIELDNQSRTIRIRDNGEGLSKKDFVARLTSLGASTKRGTSARGFRGVGRLAGLGYCRKLTFRSRAKGEALVHEMSWDCVRLKSSLREGAKDLSQIVGDIVALRDIETTDFPSHFFEVELSGVVRQGDDRLLNPVSVRHYLSQVAPVPFADDFPHRADIEDHLAGHVDLADIQISIEGESELVTRPFNSSISLSESKTDEWQGFEKIEIPGLDGNLAAVGWVLHHGYYGALPNELGVKGIRFRVGNIQVGGDDLIRDLFPEPRFNSWAVGEIHILDRRVLPNGRRDSFEDGGHINNIYNHLGPVAKGIVGKCRGSSRYRKSIRELELKSEVVQESIAIILQGVITRNQRNIQLSVAQNTLSEMSRIISSAILDKRDSVVWKTKITKLENQLLRTSNSKTRLASMNGFSRPQQQAAQKIFDLIYECAPNKTVAKGIVDRVLNRL